MEHFKDMHQPMTKVAHEAKIATVRVNVEAVQKAGSEVLLHLLKAVGPGREAALTWLLHSLLLNREITKQESNPLLRSSKGFMVNVGAIMLSLCRPIMTDPSKIKNINWRFLLAKDPNVTVLVKAPTSSSSRHQTPQQVKGGHTFNPSHRIQLHIPSLSPSSLIISHHISSLFFHSLQVHMYFLATTPS